MGIHSKLCGISDIESILDSSQRVVNALNWLGWPRTKQCAEPAETDRHG